MSVPLLSAELASVDSDPSALLLCLSAVDLPSCLPGPEHSIEIIAPERRATQGDMNREKLSACTVSDPEVHYSAQTVRTLPLHSPHDLQSWTTEPCHVNLIKVCAFSSIMVHRKTMPKFYLSR